mmetsp:Transcript_10208/g.21292  ORF Transcript_10208/g.21292 Transcript_10208/m.21292 type:complete len:131 (-) Transcript_10208:1175-1567(-)
MLPILIMRMLPRPERVNDVVRVVEVSEASSKSRKMIAVVSTKLLLKNPKYEDLLRRLPRDELRIVLNADKILLLQTLVMSSMESKGVKMSKIQQLIPKIQQKGNGGVQKPNDMFQVKKNEDRKNTPTKQL